MKLILRWGFAVLACQVAVGCDDEDEDDGTTSDLPSSCDTDPFGEACRAAYDEQCAAMTSQADCVAVPGVSDGGGTNLWCAWLEPVRYVLDGDTCTQSDEAPRCVGGRFVGEGGPMCGLHFDPADGGEGIVAAADGRCAGPYDWVSCDTAEPRPPECDCGLD